MTRFTSLLGLGAAALLGSGCLKEVCDYARCDGTGGSGGMTSSGSTSDSSSTSTIMTSSSTSSLTTECDPQKLGAAAAIDATCGIFVEPGKSGGVGTQATPFGTLTEALGANPMNLPIYVCATGPSLNESVSLVGTEQLLGAVTCGDWKATATKTAWTAPANTIPLTLTSTTGALVQGFAISSATATGFDGATLQGNSSIAVLANSATATLENVDVVAGDAAAGGDGADQSGKAPGRQSDAISFDGHAGGGCNMAGGPAQDYMTCPAGGGLTEGGKGGDGGNATGSGGAAGAPDPGLGEPNGDAGIGEPSAGMFSCGANLGDGQKGHDGANGQAGPGGTGAGSIVGTKYAGPSGGPGDVGGIGQGGGGGGGRKKSIDGCSTTGASGGSGGAGGCGGLGGAGGGAGGASIALASIDSTLTLTNVHLTAGLGGGGGAGGDGQAGGNGGLGAPGGGSACQGGGGGKGGDGAGGGGGKGGPSIGLASVGPAAAPSIDDSNISISATAAASGAAGGGNIPGLPGDAGDLSKKAVF